jgi:hypothetical protein
LVRRHPASIFRWTWSWYLRSWLYSAVVSRHCNRDRCQQRCCRRALFHVQGIIQVPVRAERRDRPPGQLFKTKLAKTNCLAKVYHIVLSLLLLCVGCHRGVSAPGLNPSIDSVSTPVNEVDSNLTNYYREAPVLAYREPEVVQPLRKTTSISDVYLSQLGVCEATGHNDGREVEKYLRSVGLGKGYAWCAAFVHWCFDSAGIRTSINGAAASAHNPKDLVWYQRTQLKIPEPGDVFTLWFNAMGRIGHTGFFPQESK